MRPDDVLESILEATHKGDIEAVASILERHPDWVAVQQQVGGLKQPLHFAASAGNGQMIRYLVERGAPVDPRDRGGMTPLHCAARSGQRDAIELLIAAGADVHARDGDGRSALYWAMQAYNPYRQRVVELLLEQGFCLDVYCSLILGDLAEASRLLEGQLDLSSGASSDALIGAALLAASDVAPRFQEGTEASTAACMDIARIIRSMVARGASLSRFDDALWMSVKLNNTIVLECLLEIEKERSVFTETQKQLLARRLLDSCSYSVDREAMSDLVRRHGFSDRQAAES